MFENHLKNENTIKTNKQQWKSLNKQWEKKVFECSWWMESWVEIFGKIDFVQKVFGSTKRDCLWIWMVKIG